MESRWPPAPPDSHDAPTPGVGGESFVSGSAQPASTTATVAEKESPAPSQEVELKLLLDPTQLPRLRRHPSLQALSLGPPTTRQLDSVYFDTPDLALLGQDTALRVRRVEGRYVQTVKARGGSSAGLFERLEVECSVDGERPELSRIPDPALRASVEERVGDHALEPVLETRVRRSQWRLRENETELFFDLDVGDIQTPRGSLPICELELELVEGDPRVLYDVAIELLDGVPLRLGTRSKFDRGLDLLTGERPLPQRAERLRLRPEATLEEALESILRACLGQILANEGPAHEGLDPEGVHQMRVGVRRMRSALSLFRRLLPAEALERFAPDLRWLSSELGDARDMDVFIEETLEPLFRRFPDNGGLKRLRDEALQMRTEAYVRVRQAIESRRHTELLLLLGRWIAAKGWRQQALSPESAQLFLPARDVTRGLLEKRHRKARKLGRHLRERSIDEKHALRIQLKKLRYAAEFLRSLHHPKRAARYAKRLARLQEVLGHLNDVATGERVMDALAERLNDEKGPHRRAAGFVLGWIARGAEDRLEGLPREWKDFAETRRFWDESD